MLAVGLAVEDELIGRRLETVDGGLGQEGIGHLGDPLDGLAVRRHQRRGRPVTLDDQFVDVGGVEGVERLKGEVVEDEQVDPHEFAHLGVVGVVEPVARSRLSDTSVRRNTTL